MPTVLVGVVISLVAFFVPKDGLWINDNGCKLLQVRSLDKNGPLDASLSWPGAAVDPNFQYVPIRPPFGHIVEGKLFVQYSPVFALASLLPFRAFGMPGLYLLPLVGGILTVEAVRRLSVSLVTANSPESVDESQVAIMANRASVFGAVIAGLATPLMFYSSVFWEHTLSTALVSWAVVFMLKRLRGAERTTIIASATLLALSIYFRDDLYLLMAVWAGMLLLSSDTRRDFFLFVSIGLVICVPLWVYQYFAVGYPLGLHFRGGSPFQSSLSAHFMDRWPVIRNLFLNSVSHPQVSVITTLPFLVSLVFAIRTPFAISSTASLVMSFLALVAGLAVMIDHVSSPAPMPHLMSANSFFAACPVLLLAFFCPTGCTMNSKSVGSLSARWLVHLVFLYFVLSAMIMPNENTVGVHWGCRFLLPAYPLLAALAGSTLASLFTVPKNRAALRWTAGSLVVVSLALQAYSVSLLCRRQSSSAELNRLVSQAKADVIVTDTWYLAQELAPVFFDRPIFLVNNQTDWNELEFQLADNGVRNTLLIHALPIGVAPPNLAVFDDGLGLIRVGMEIQSLGLIETNR